MGDAKNTILIRKDEWKEFITTVNALVDAQAQLLKNFKEYKAGPPQASQKLIPVKHRKNQSRKIFVAQTKKNKIRMSSGIYQFCIACGRKILKNDKYCSHCGNQIV